MESLRNVDLLERVRAAALDDEAERPMARDKDEVPWAFEGVTAEWLDACIGSGAGQPAIERIETRAASSGTSVRGAIRAIRPDGDDRIFAKTYPDFAHRLANVVTQTAQAEGRFYREVRPLLDIETPTGYHWAADEERFRAIVLVEDIAATRDATFCNQASAINHSEAESAVDLLAELHGRFLGDETAIGRFAWLRSYYDWSSSFLQLKVEHLRAVEQAAAVMPSALRAAGEPLYDAFLRVREDTQAGERTILHSDVHLGNWYKVAGGRLGLCDWQCINVGDPARDLAYAVSTLLNSADRRAWEGDLVSRYAARLSEISGRPVDRDALFLRYRRWMLGALMMWTPTLVPMDNFPAMQSREMSMLMIARTSTAIDDLNSLAVA